MDSETIDILFSEAESFFIKNKYDRAEPILNQLVLKNCGRAEVFHMLGTIYYSQNHFNKAIRAFKRALDINPDFTDSSVGLSIILNDLGRYDEGKKVFEEAHSRLDKKKNQSRLQSDKVFADKHAELGDLYQQHARWAEAEAQYKKALELEPGSLDLRMKLILLKSVQGDVSSALKEIRTLLAEHPRYVPARLKLAQIFYDQKQIPEAIEQWETILRYDPDNKIAIDLIRIAQTLNTTQLHSVVTNEKYRNA